MHRRFTRWVCGFYLVWLGGVAGGAEVPTPESHLGFQPGADYKLASWAAVASYYQKVDAASDRVVVRELGRTTEDRPYLAAFVSSAANIAKLYRYRAIQRTLAQPTGPEPVAHLAELVDESKTVVLITCSIHANETASTLMSLELLHRLATADDPATAEILDKTILILVPSANPDGVDIVANWYERTKGKPWEGDGLPWLYHKYAGHDTNRDWFMLNLKETQLLTHLLYHEWFPTMAYDVHQMGSKGARLFVPPFFDPINPNLDPKTNQGIFLIGAHMAADLAEAGKPGVLTNAMYDNWWNGGNRTSPQRHNIVAVLTEAASVKLASPIFLEKSQLAGATRGFANHEPAVNFVDPWEGGWWRLRDIIDYELIAARSMLTLAARYKTQFQTNYHMLGVEAIQKGQTEPPYGWVVRADGRDPGTAASMIKILDDSGIQVQTATSSFRADGVLYPEGTWFLPAAQPYRGHLKDLMERQHYPNRLKPDGSAETPYDVAGWTLPLQMGVPSMAVAAPLAANFEKVSAIKIPTGRIDGVAKPEFFTLADTANDDFRTVNALLAAGVPVGRLPARATSGEETLEAGTWIIRADPAARDVLAQILPRTSSVAVGRSGLSTALPRPIKAPVVGLYQPWAPSMDEGWTRLVLEKFDFPYLTLHDAEIRAGSLIARFDTIILPSVTARILRDGQKPGETEPAYVGGLGPMGIDSLRDFVRQGGKLICLEESCQFAIEAFGLPVKDVLKDLKSSEFYAPGSVIRAEAVAVGDIGSSSVMLGEPATFSVYFDRSMAFEVPAKSNLQNPSVIVAQYAALDPLESGWLLGAEKLQGKGAIVVSRCRRGVGDPVWLSAAASWATAWDVPTSVQCDLCADQVNESPDNQAPRVGSFRQSRKNWPELCFVVGR